MKLTKLTLLSVLGLLLLTTSCSRYGGHFVRTGNNKNSTVAKHEKKATETVAATAIEDRPEHESVSTPVPDASTGSSATVSTIQDAGITKNQGVKSKPAASARLNSPSAPSSAAKIEKSRSAKEMDKVEKTQVDAGSLAKTGLIIFGVGLLLYIIGAVTAVSGAVAGSGGGFVFGAFLLIVGYIGMVIGVILLLVALILWLLEM